MPTWYHPTYVGGPWHGGYRRPMREGMGQPVLPSSGGGSFSPGGLESMNRSMTDGINAMSKGLTQMLNQTSRVMNSRPQSSGKGGFSGGGRGGGSGGGRAGFG